MERWGEPFTETKTLGGRIRTIGEDGVRESVGVLGLLQTRPQAQAAETTEMDLLTVPELEIPMKAWQCWSLPRAVRGKSVLGLSPRVPWF